MPTPRRTVLLSRLAACVLFVGVGALPAAAQPADLPPQVVTQAKLSDEDLKQLTAFIERYKAQLANDKDRNAVKVARVRLIEPLMNPQASVDFRIRYSEALSPVLEPLVKSTSDFIASNAVQILGELATPRAVERITAVLADKRPSVRYSASYAIQRVFENLLRSNPGLTSEQTRTLVDTVTTRLTSEDDANVAQGLVMALEAASEIPASQVRDVRAYSVTSAAKGVAARAKAMDGKQAIDPRWRQVIWRTARLTRTALTQAPPNEPRLTDDALKASGGLAGHTIALALRRVKNGLPAGEERDILAQSVALAEATYFFASSNLGGKPNEAQLSKLVLEGDAAKFEAAAMDIIGPNGVLTSPTFGFPDNEFVPGKP